MKNKCPSQALTLSKPIIHKLESYWFNLRFKNTEIPLEKLLINTDHTKSEIFTPKLSEALEIYFKLKGHGKGDIFFRASKRAIKDTIKRPPHQ